MRVHVGFADALTTLGCGPRLWRHLLDGAEGGLVPAGEIFSQAPPGEGHVGCFRAVPPDESRITWLLHRMYEAFLLNARIEACDVVLLASNFGDLTASCHRTILEEFESFFSAHMRSIHLPSVLISSACSSGSDAVAWGASLVEAGCAETVAILSVDCFDVTKYLQHRALGTLSTSRARPFDRRRDGTSFGEGGALVVLGTARGLRGLELPTCALIRGVGASCDGHDLITPEPSGRFPALAIKRALASAQDIRQVDFIKCHGTGTRLNDQVEARALHLALGPIASDVPAFSTKGAFGHLLGAAGLVESVIAIWALREGVIPGTCGLEELDPEVPLNVIPESRLVGANVGLALSLGFGGVNSAIVMERPND